MTGQSSSYSDYDYFKLYSSGVGTTQFALTLPSGNYTSYYVNIYDSTGTLQKSYTTSSSATYSVATTAAGYSYISVNSNSTANYTITASSTVSAVTDDYPYSLDTIGVLDTVGSLINGNIETPDDYDLFKVNLISGNTYVISATAVSTSNGDPYLLLFDPLVNKISEDDDSGGGTTAKITYTATSSGTFYVGVTDSNSAGTGKYQVSVSKSPTYSITAGNYSVNEGSIATFTLSTNNTQTNATIPYTITGLSASDVVGGALSGLITFNSSGTSTINISISNDLLTEGSETLTFSAGGQSASVIINDTSTTAPASTYSISPFSKNVDEGSEARFTLLTTNVAVGTSLTYTITGVSTSDLVSGTLSGAVVINSLRSGAIVIPIASDFSTEGTETLTITLQGASASVVINDTSTSTSINSNLAFIPLVSGKYFYSTPGPDKAVGTSYVDVIKESSTLAANQITKLSDGSWQVQNKTTPSNSDNLVNIERIEFSDLSVALDLTGAAGQVAKILGSVFGKSYVSNTAFAGIGLAYMDDGMSYKDLCGLAAGAAGLSTADVLVTTLLRNVTGVEPTSTSKAPYLKLLTDGVSFSDVVQKISDLSGNAENIKLTDLTNSGLAYTPFIFPATPTYAISATAPSVNEGASATFNLTTTNVAAGTEISYSLAGVTTADLTSGSLLGKVIVNSSGLTAINIPIAADLFTEGAETLVLSTQGVSASLTINDTSKSVIAPTYVLSAVATSIKEGEIARFNVSTTNVSTGTALQYSLVGVTTGDIVGGLTRTVVVDATGKAVIDIATLKDNLVEGNETMTVVLGNAQASITLVDVILVGVELPVSDGA